MKEYERNTPEWVVKVRLYFFVGSSLALDVDAGLTAVTSSCGKGKYGEDLQSGHNVDAWWLNDWPVHTSFQLVQQTSGRKCFLNHQIDWGAIKINKKNNNNNIKTTASCGMMLFVVFFSKWKLDELSDREQLTAWRSITRTRTMFETLF